MDFRAILAAIYQTVLDVSGLFLMFLDVLYISGLILMFPHCSGLFWIWQDYSRPFWLIQMQIKSSCL